MKKTVKIGLIVAGMFTVTGLSVAEVREYIQVARNRAGAAIQDSIPLDVEIDRMQVLIGKLDRQVASQKYAVAQSKIALQDSEAEYARSQSRCNSLLTEMKQLRTLNAADSPSGGCHTVSYRAVSTTDIRRALRYKLTAYREAESTCAAQQTAMAQHHQAYTELENQFANWQSQRRLLGQRLETLKARHQTQQLASETNASAFNNADLARATELANQIERELRIVEAQRALGADPSVSLLSDTPEAGLADIEAEVDRLIAGR